MEPAEKDKQTTDPQQHEISGNILGGVFEAFVGDTKGRAGEEDARPSASQTGGVENAEEEEEGHS